MATQPQNDGRLLQVTVTPEDFGALERAASERRLTVNDYVRDEVVRLAHVERRSPEASLEDLNALLRSAQEEMRRANPENRDLAAELIADRRAEAARE